MAKRSKGSHHGKGSFKHPKFFHILLLESFLSSVSKSVGRVCDGIRISVNIQDKSTASDFTSKHHKKKALLSTGEHVENLLKQLSLQQHQESFRAKSCLTKGANCLLLQPESQQMKKIALIVLFFFLVVNVFLN